MGRNTNAPFSTFISARLPSLAFMASANALGIRTARLFPHLQNSTIIPPLQGVDTVYIHDGSTAGKGPTPRHHDRFYWRLSKLSVPLLEPLRWGWSKSSGKPS